MCLFFQGVLRIGVCLPVWREVPWSECECVASNLELLINLALPHVSEQIPAGLSDASCRREHCLSGLHEDVNDIFITPNSHKHPYI